MKTIIFFVSLWHSELKKDRCLANFFQPGSQKHKSRAQQTLWGKIFLLRWVQIWHSFELSTKEIFDFRRKHNNRSGEAAFAVSRGLFGRKQFFWNFWNFVSLTRKFALWAKKIGFQQEDWNRVVRTSFFMSRKTVKKNLFAGKDYKFLQFFRPLSARKEWLLPWIVGMSAETEFSQSAGKIWPKLKIFEKN